MILEIDMGNTFAKWRVRQDDGVVRQRGRTPTVDFPSLDIRNLAGIQRIRLAAVCEPGHSREVMETLQQSLRVVPEEATTLALVAGVTNAYAVPAHMGVDRWLAMLAAYHGQSPKAGCMVVSCGTAVTLDFVRENGRHEGGYILPGMHMMRMALLSGTGRIRFDASGFDVARTPGDSTSKAVEHGAVHALLAAIEQAYLSTLARWGQCQLVMTGGDATGLISLLAVPSCYTEDLVLDGLQYALP